MADLPRKAVTRTARMAALPLGYAGRQALGVGKRLGGAPAEVVMNEVQTRTAAQLFKTLGELKGGAMKFGQALSIFEGALPEEIAAPYREQLTKLQDSAPPMSRAVVHQQLVREFGAGWKRKIVEFDEEAAASASIGQVHHGRWVDGTEVAVKLQYPGAEQAMLADLKQITRLARTFGGLLPGIDVKLLAEELRDRVAEELDYRLEAEAQSRFAEVYADDPHYVVPRVMEFSQRAIVTEWVPGTSSLAKVISGGTQEERDHWGELYARFLFESPARTGLLHADPHPGNFRLVPGEGGAPDRLAVLDYGAVARLPGGELPVALGVLSRLSLGDDWDAVVTFLRQEGFIKPNIRVRPDDLRSYLGPFTEPARTRTFRFSRDFLRAQLARVQDPSSPEVQVAFRLNLPPEYLLVHRTWTGAVGVLCQLEAEVPFREILEGSLPGFATSPG
ncbi:ABC1 kinase family protein [Nocardioides marmoribigeumensis]|uniref:Unusual protein kinase regulating ubiquinone biosynthesis (AarF/ABC1/UbiB family) n=1 Tax=Nocardioides marmoribigeumensis TaxID=433649 RepID=A0ABU2BSL8_9ACTN|nr:AarF/ABC1/UbiB kinase family protein [Nocardioides marmoribigeumensis]MDR7361629.1 putative unusual protein kinase regulating ubiquinone biosynthesis (AarF/ABC1/UbiB family) [Nocardioides marmoribigeumensis]